MNKTFVKLAAIAGMLCSALATLHAQPIAGPNRPASVPEGYVITPFGYFHPSCVAHLARGDEMRPDERVVRHADGSSTPMHVCEYPHYRADGESVFGDERNLRKPDITHAYVEDATVTTTSSYGSLYAEWSVPKPPVSQDGQTIFFFPGLEDITHVVTILQPVLGWNSDFANSWGIASWNCCVSGTTFEATPATTTTGDTIYGSMVANCPSGTTVCTSWTVVTKDLQNAHISTLAGTSNFGQTFNWAYGAALEVYNVIQCSDYPVGGGLPGSTSLAMTDIGLYSNKQVQVSSPAWVVAITSGLTPSCKYSVSQPKQLILNY